VLSEDRGVPATTVRKKIALVGYTMSRADAPWGDPAWDDIGCNNLHIQIPEQWPQATGWHNLHRWKDIVVDPAHVEWLQSTTVPVFMFPEAIAAAAKDGYEFPTVVPFPYLEIIDTFSGRLTGNRYFTNSIAWMIAFSIVRLVEAGVDDTSEIALYGIDLAQQTEYVVERPCVEYWLAVAECSGIKVTVAPTADILKCAGLYGVDEGVADLAVKLFGRRDELVKQLEERVAVHEELRSNMEVNRYHEHMIRGALENTNYIIQSWLQSPGDVRKGGADPYSTQAGEPEQVGALSG
jgi:hypothetical protein